ncbi:MAG: glycosyltransferase [Candidatus Omnitrophota bacterium]
MSESPLVSVIAPFYNDVKYFPEALASYLSQTYPSIEMVVIDDNSEIAPNSAIPDNLKYPVRIVRSSKRLGPAAARNMGIRQAKGELIAFLDSDDIWTPRFIERAVEVFSKSKDADWVYSDGRYIIDGKPVKKPNSFYFGFKNGLPQGKEVNRYHLKGYVFELMSANVVRRAAIDKVGFFDESLEISEDWEFFCRIAERCSVYAIDESLMYYRRRSDGFHYSKLENYIQTHSDILKRMYDRQGLLPHKEADLKRAVALACERVGIQYMNKGNPLPARRYFTHPAIAPLRFNFRVMVLKALSFFPPVFYKMAIKLYDLII